MPAIRGIHLSKSYHYYQVLRQVSFEVAEGECYALLGPNGAGKTTLLRILATALRPSMGQFEIMGYDGIRNRDKVREYVFLVGHGSYLYDELDALENIRFSTALRGAFPTDREIKLALDRVGIGAFAGLRVRFFSMGMKKRLAIAKATLLHPKVLLLDEPYASLDEGGMKMMNAFIREVARQGSAVLLTTHDRLRSAEVANRGGVLVRGELKEILASDLTAADELF